MVTALCFTSGHNTQIHHWLFSYKTTTVLFLNMTWSHLYITQRYIIVKYKNTCTQLLNQWSLSTDSTYSNQSNVFGVDLALLRHFPTCATLKNLPHVFPADTHWGLWLSPSFNQKWGSMCRNTGLKARNFPRQIPLNMSVWVLLLQCTSLSVKLQN